MDIVLNGVKFGVVLALLVGPVFFTIIQVSIEKGFWSGVMVTLGTSVSDTIYVTICYFGLVQLIDDPQFRMWLAYVGGMIMIVFGLYHLLVKSRKNESKTLGVEENKPFYRYFIKGFVINGLSPSVFVFWVGTASLATLSFGYDAAQFIIFFAALLGTVLITDILKAYLAGKLRTLVTHHFLMILNIGLGAALVIFGVRLIFLAKTITFN